MVVLWNPDTEVSALASVCRRGGIPEILGEFLLTLRRADPVPRTFSTRRAWSLSLAPSGYRIFDGSGDRAYTLSEFTLRFGMWPTPRTVVELGLDPEQSSRGVDHIYLWDAFAGKWLYRDHRMPITKYARGVAGKENLDVFQPLTHEVIERYRHTYKVRF